MISPSIVLVSTFSHHLYTKLTTSAAYGITWSLTVTVGIFMSINVCKSRKSFKVLDTLIKSYEGKPVHTQQPLFSHSSLHSEDFYLFDDPWTICLIFSKVMYTILKARVKKRKK